MGRIPERESLDPACASTVAALENDPFYCCITAEFAQDDARRRAALAEYFGYSIREGMRIGRTVHLADLRQGVAVWVLPQAAQLLRQEAMHKREFLQKTLGEAGCTNYSRIIDSMKRRAEATVSRDSWYLSIVAVDPKEQGRGLGSRLLAPTLAEADAAGALCYLETFSPRNLAFYERLGFTTRARFHEPAVRAEYAIMVRDPVLAAGR